MPPFQLEIDFRDETTVNLPGRKGSKQRNLTRVSSHKLNQTDAILCAKRFSFRASDRTLGFLYRSVKAKAAINKRDILINRLCNTTYSNARFSLSRFRVELVDGAMRTVATNNYALRSSSNKITKKKTIVSRVSQRVGEYQMGRQTILKGLPTMLKP